MNKFCHPGSHCVSQYSFQVQKSHPCFSLFGWINSEQAIFNSKEAPHGMIDVTQVTICMCLKLNWLLHNSFEASPNGFQTKEHVIPPHLIIVKKYNLSTLSHCQSSKDNIREDKIVLRGLLVILKIFH
jgi:hypothetical protein